MAAMEAGEIRREARDADQTVSDLMRNMGPPVPRRTSSDQRAAQAERQAAQREQQALKQELETYWTEQSKRTEKFTIRQDDVDKLARKLVREFGGAYDAAEISSELKAAAEILLDVSSPEMTVEEVYNTVRPTARKLVENALEKVSRDDAEDRQEMEKQAFTWVEQKEKKYEELARKKIEQEKQRREREAQKLRESVSQQRAALREQLRRTTDPKANRESANRLARKLVQEYDSLAKPGEIGKTIAEAAEYVWRTAQGQEEFSSDALRDILEPAARELVENAAALVNAEQDKDWQDIRPMIQGRFSIPRSVSDTWQDLGQWNRDNKGRMSAGVDESGRRSADSAYEELSKRWPQYFPKEATDTRERLEIMSAAWDQLQPTWENPHNANLDAAAESAVTDMVKRIFNLRRADVRNADKTNRDDAYYTAVAQAYNRVIEETQPNYTTMQRGANLRSDNELLRSLLMFKTQSFQNFNILYDSIENFRAKMNENGGFTEAEKKQAGRDLSRAVISQLAANALYVAIGALVNDLPKDKKDKYADEDGNVTPLSAAMALGKDMISSAAGMVPMGTEAWDFIRAAAFHDRYYGIEAANISFVSDLASRFLSFASFVEKGLQVNEDGTRNGYNPLLLALEAGRLIEAVSKGLGIPVQNAANIFTSSARGVFRLAGMGAEGDYRMLTLTGNPVSSGAYDLLYQALAQGDYDGFQRIAEDMQKHYRTSGGTPITGKTIRDRMLARYRDEAAKSGGTRLSQKALDYIGAVETYQADEKTQEDRFTEADLTPAQHRKYMEDYAGRYRTIADAVNRASGFSSMNNDQRASAMKYAYQLATKSALADNSGGQLELDTQWMLWASGGAAYNVTEDMAILFKTAYDSTESDRDKSGSAVTGSRKKKVLTLVKDWMPGLTKQQSRYLQSFFWEAENAKLRKLKENGYR